MITNGRKWTLSTDLPRSPDDPLRGRQILEAHRAARVEAVGADPDLRAEAELSAV